MHFKSLNFLIASLLFTSIAFANPTFIIPEGSADFAGQELDTSKFRAASIMANSNGEIIFENFFHQDKFWTARIKKNAQIEGVFMNVVEFDVIPGVTAAHVQTRVRFAEGSSVMLTGSGGVIEVNDIVFSSEAGRPEGVGYNFLKGIKPNYMLVPRIASGEQRVSEYDSSYSTHQYEIDLTAEESMQYVVSEIQDSARIGLGNFYGSLKPNCVTERFRILDQLLAKRGGKTPEPFLTMFSNDPVSGPTLDGLRERGVLGERKANLEVEVSTGVKLYIPSSDENQSPKTDQKSILAEIEGSPYALVFVASEELLSNPDFINAKKEAYQLLPQFVENVLASSLTESLTDGSPNILGAFKQLSPVIKTSLSKMTDSLGDTAQAQFSLYFTPWDEANGREVDALKELKVDARLPLKTFEKADGNQTRHDVHLGLSDALKFHTTSEANFGAMGLALHINLDKRNKDASSINLQAVGHIGALSKEMDIKNDQVIVTDFVIPEVSPFNEKPVAILNLGQGLQEGQSPTVNVSFGGFGGLSYENEKSGVLKIDDWNSERFRSYSVPSLQGHVPGKGVVGVWLDIFSVDFDPENLLVSNVDVRTSSGLNIAGRRLKSGLVRSVVSDSSVNALFAGSANDKLASIDSSAGLSLLNTIFSNNEGSKILPEVARRVVTKETSVLLSCRSIL